MPSLRSIRAFDWADFILWLNNNWLQYRRCYWIVLKDDSAEYSSKELEVKGNFRKMDLDKAKEKKNTGKGSSL